MGFLLYPTHQDDFIPNLTDRIKAHKERYYTLGFQKMMNDQEVNI